jgi:hypothetical protein
MLFAILRRRARGAARWSCRSRSRRQALICDPSAGSRQTDCRRSLSASIEFSNPSARVSSETSKEGNRGSGKEPCTARVYDFCVLARLSRKMEEPLYPSGISSFTLRHIAFVDRLPWRYVISVENIQSRLTHSQSLRSVTSVDHLSLTPRRVTSAEDQTLPVRSRISLYDQQPLFELTESSRYRGSASRSKACGILRAS